MNDVELKKLTELVEDRGGTITPRQLQHACRRYRTRADDARLALHALVEKGIARWVDHQTLKLKNNSQYDHYYHCEPEETVHQSTTELVSTETPAVTEIDTQVSEVSAGSQETVEVVEIVASETEEVAEKEGVTEVEEVVTEGNVTAVTDASDDEEQSVSREGWAAASNRWRREGVKEDADAHREQIRVECLSKGVSRHEAMQRAWESAIAAFPPPGQVPVELPVVPVVEAQEPPKKTESVVAGSGHLQGLGQIPGEWPTLPANSSLPAEIGWVQANRLRIVEEKSAGAAVVRLERALSPAPSHAALGWLETSIRSYAKYVDVVARSLQTVQDEQESVRRERVQVQEIGTLLQEMSV